MARALLVVRGCSSAFPSAIDDAKGLLYMAMTTFNGVDREVRVRILADVRPAAALAQTRYAETEASLVAREAAEARRRLEREPAHSRKGRPTKRDRREMASFVESGRDDDGF